MKPHPHVLVADLPGADLVHAGVAALGAVARGEREDFTPEALLVAIGARRLRAAGLTVPDAPGWPRRPELALYEAIGETHADAHSRYNALIRRLVSFERALEARNRRYMAMATNLPPTPLDSAATRAGDADRQRPTSTSGDTG